MDNPDNHELNAYERPFNEFRGMPSQVELTRKRRRFLASLVLAPLGLCLLLGLAYQVEYYFSDENKARTELEPKIKQIAGELKNYEFTEEASLKKGLLPIKLRAVDKQNIDKFNGAPELDYEVYKALDPKLRANLQNDAKMVLRCIYYREIVKEKFHKTRRSRSGNPALIGMHTTEFVALTLHDLETKSQMYLTVIEGSKTKIENSADFESRLDLVTPSQITNFLKEIPLK